MTSKSSFITAGVFVITGIFGIMPAQSIATAASNSFAARCAEIDKCIKAVSEITNDKYVFSTEVKGTVAASDNLELTKENATFLLTKALNLNGFTRAPLGEPNTYEVVRQRDARDTLLPKVTADVNNAPDLPNTWDWYHLTYKAKYPDAVESMARTARSFMPATARIIPVELSGQLMMTAAAPDIKNVYEMIRHMDQKPSKEILEKWKQRERERAQERKNENFAPVQITPKLSKSLEGK